MSTLALKELGGVDSILKRAFEALRGRAETSEGGDTENKKKLLDEKNEKEAKDKIRVQTRDTKLTLLTLRGEASLGMGDFRPAYKDFTAAQTLCARLRTVAKVELKMLYAPKEGSRRFTARSKTRSDQLGKDGSLKENVLEKRLQRLEAILKSLEASTGRVETARARKFKQDKKFYKSVFKYIQDSGAMEKAD
jgi:hypothetical protein